jgi:hypothetical protein
MMYSSGHRNHGAQGLYRYSLLQSNAHWFPGTFATEAALANVDASKASAGMDVEGMLRETHRELHKKG